VHISFRSCKKKMATSGKSLADMSATEHTSAALTHATNAASKSSTIQVILVLIVVLIIFVLYKWSKCASDLKTCNAAAAKKFAVGDSVSTNIPYYVHGNNINTNLAVQQSDFTGQANFADSPSHPQGALPAHRAAQASCAKTWSRRAAEDASGLSTAGSMPAPVSFDAAAQKYFNSDGFTNDDALDLYKMSGGGDKKSN